MDSESEKTTLEGTINEKIADLAFDMAEEIADLAFDMAEDNGDYLQDDKILDDFTEECIIPNNNDFYYNQINSRPLSNTSDAPVVQFNLEEAQKALVESLLLEKRKIMKVVANPNKYMTKKKKSLVIDEDGGFTLSDDETPQQQKTPAAQNKNLDDINSVSTYATIENVNFLVYDINPVLFDQMTFSIPRVKSYCKKVSKLLG
jgi:ubiquitin C-terminal hydrolase